ncbi:MAG: hypothetical protein KDJ67_07675 [Nitratireductor sp.]|nr:hypothetical protein [Nitratireductor sp.]
MKHNSLRIQFAAFRIEHVVTGLLALVVMVLLGLQGTALAQSGSAGNVTRVTLEARMTDTSEALMDGVEWRIFATKVGEDGKLPMLAQATGGVKAFDITPGDYYVHAAFGYAGAVRRITVGETPVTETFTLNAGGLQLNAVASNDARIPSALLRFDVYSKEQDERGERQLVARNIKSNEIVPFHAGTYHVVSQYGRLNAEVRADFMVEAGKVTKATIVHRAARITFKLVKTAGGDAIANTAWSILTESGDVITESNSAFPAFVLSEGTYSAIAKNADKIYSREFTVDPGVNRDVEVLAE